MADYDLLKQLRASREAKTRAVTKDVGGIKGRYEFDRDKASRLAEGVPFHMRPSNYNSPDFSKDNQHQGDREVTGRGWPSEGPASYYDDAKDSDWVRSPDESSEKSRPARFDTMESKSRKPGYAKPPGRIPDNPAELGPGHRQSPSRR